MSFENYTGSIARAEYKPDIERLLAENKEMNVIIVDIRIPFWELTKFVLKLFFVLLVIGLVVKLFLVVFGGVLLGIFR